MEPELPLPVTDPWWQPCPELKSFLDEDMKWGWGLLGSLVMLCWTVMPSWQGTVVNNPLGPCSPLPWVPVGSLCWHPWGGVTPQPPPSKAGTAVTLTQLTKSATQLPARDLVAK